MSNCLFDGSARHSLIDQWCVSDPFLPNNPTCMNSINDSCGDLLLADLDPVWNYRQVKWSCCFHYYILVHVPTVRILDMPVYDIRTRFAFFVLPFRHCAPSMQELRYSQTKEKERKVPDVICTTPVNWQVGPSASASVLFFLPHMEGKGYVPFALSQVLGMAWMARQE